MASKAQSMASHPPQMSLTFGVMLVAAALMLLATVMIDRWVVTRITHAMLLRSAGPSGTTMSQFIEPLLNGIETELRASPEKIAALDKAYHDLKVHQNVIAMRIWRPNGQIYYASDHGAIDTWLDTDEIAEALTGKIYSYLDNFDDGGAVLRESERPIYEVYVPLINALTQEVIAVEEFHVDASDLQVQIAQTRFETWRMTGGISLFMLGILYLLVRRGDRMLIAQRRALEELQAGQMAFQKANQALREQIAASEKDLVELDQRVQRRVGIELHDGPAQLLTYILLRMDEIEADQRNKATTRPGAEALVDSVRQAAAQALTDLTRVSKGLFLQETDAHNASAGSLRRIIGVHEKRSGTRVTTEGIDTLPPLSPHVLLCAAQLLREALTNGYKHAPGAGQHVQVELTQDTLLLGIRDNGPGIPVDVLNGQRSGLGLQGMRYRVEALGGTMLLASSPDQGTQINFLLPLDPPAGPLTTR
jgi:signal transduction histidine kinase